MLNNFWWQQTMEDMVLVHFNTMEIVVICHITYGSKTWWILRVKSSLYTFPENASKRSLCAAVVKPHQAGEAYCNLEITVDWKTFWRSALFIPCCFRIRRAYRALAELEITDVMCSSMEKLSAKTTPNVVMLLTLGIPGISGTWGILFLRVCGL